MLYRILYIILFLSCIQSQSFFSRVYPEELLHTDARSLAMGHSILSSGENSAVMISNPAHMTFLNNRISIPKLNRISIP